MRCTTGNGGWLASRISAHSSAWRSESGCGPWLSRVARIPYLTVPYIRYSTSSYRVNYGYFSGLRVRDKNKAKKGKDGRELGFERAGAAQSTSWIQPFRSSTPFNLPTTVLLSVLTLASSYVCVAPVRADILLSTDDTSSCSSTTYPRERYTIAGGTPTSRPP